MMRAESGDDVVHFPGNWRAIFDLLLGHVDVFSKSLGDRLAGCRLVPAQAG